MVMSEDGPQEEEAVQEEIAEVIEEVPAIITSSDVLSFDFQVADTDRLGLSVYTVLTKIPDIDEEKTFIILAPNYDVALELAGINKGNTVKVSGVAFEG